ncbi:uncharacterized protein BYT42DRAFT_639134 [Radiomyces spectabilis]|uniref:uncharacterized protein n=1 Tax=Radiomyces spectabilis TaxID=64574 RepID=UPI00221FEFF4|nr:uncharacterized protein BYT42DRAFT_639134 [Radiomyces spectabilis]KAI8374183.1 hypothetical protein BYT42DRAFT_639134 [Radiomyces spectabilis]
MKRSRTWSQKSAYANCYQAYQACKHSIYNGRYLRCIFDCSRREKNQDRQRREKPNDISAQGTVTGHYVGFLK